MWLFVAICNPEYTYSDTLSLLHCSLARSSAPLPRLRLGIQPALSAAAAKSPSASGEQPPWSHTTALGSKLLASH